MYTVRATAIKTFASDERGVVSMTLALMITALFFLAGFAVDYSRAVNVRSRLSDAADAAALAAGRALMEGKSTAAEIRTLALAHFNQNVKSVRSQADIDTPSINVNLDTGGVSISVKSHVKLTLARLSGYNTLDVPIKAAVNFSQKDIEVGMALDITGSMAWNDANGAPKMEGLKSAFEKFARQLLLTNRGQQEVRIGIAPYSTAVNLGSFAQGVSTSNASDCVVERRTGKRYSDESGSFFGAPQRICPSAPIIPMTKDYNTLVNAVNAFTPEGGTAGHLGVQWAWNLVSPVWGSTWGSDSAGVEYSEVEKNKVLKAVVLMTDGEFNTRYNGPSSATQAVAICEAMKAEGVAVFSVGFGLGGDAAALQTLKSCASPGPGYFADAATGEDLESAFDRFADKLSELRLTQ